MRDAGHPHFEVEDLVVVDEVRGKVEQNKIQVRYSPWQRCGFTYCPICRLDTQTAHVVVRGLCTESLYNTAYTLARTGAGGLRFRAVNNTSQKFQQYSENAPTHYLPYYSYYYHSYLRISWFLGFSL